MIGTSIFDYLHEDDQFEVGAHFDLLPPRSNRKAQGLNDAKKRSFQNGSVDLSVRFKSTLIKKSLPNKYSGWRVSSKVVNDYQLAG